MWNAQDDEERKEGREGCLTTETVAKVIELQLAKFDKIIPIGLPFNDVKLSSKISYGHKAWKCQQIIQTKVVELAGYLTGERKSIVI